MRLTPPKPHRPYFTLKTPQNSSAMADIAQELNRWHAERFSSEVDDKIRLAYLFSPEWDTRINTQWTAYDELEKRRAASKTPRLKWQDGVEGERDAASSVRKKSFVPIHQRLWPMRPLWVHLNSYHNRPDHDDEQRHNGWASMLDSWKEIQRLMRDDKAFRDSLSPTQQRSFQLLLSWWQAEYCDQELLDTAIGCLERCRPLKITFDPSSNRRLERIAKSVATDTSLYHAKLFRNFLLEFHPLAWEPFISHHRLFLLQYSRYKAACAATMQKLSHAILYPVAVTPKRYPRVIQNDTDTQRLIGQQTSIKPYYLWDSSTQKTVVVAELSACPEYVCISHTWGRWRPKDRTSVEVPGIPWLVPENTLYDVRDVPEQLVRLKHRYIWLDLFCIPQDKSKRAEIEISRQTFIFQGSSHCIAWVYDVESWDGVGAALDWICLRSLSILSHRHTDVISKRVPKATTAAQTPMELLTRKPLEGVPPSDDPYEVISGDPSGWLSSLWTLQECVLCPDIELYSRTWVRLEDRRGSPISLRALMVFLRKTERHCWLKGPIETPFSKPDEHDTAIINHPDRDQRASVRKWSYPGAVRDLFYLCMMTRLDNVLTSGSPTTVLTNSNLRVCSRSRAPAIMSAVGVTEWYLKSPSKKREEQLVFGKYPLSFLREAASKFGAIFYESMANKMPRSRSTQELRHILLRGEREGTMLPVSKSPAWINGDKTTDTRSPEWFSKISGSVEHTYIDRQDHPSVSKWSIEEDGSVSMSSAGIALTSKDESQARKIVGHIYCATAEMDADGRAVAVVKGVEDMLETLRGLRNGSRVIYAVALYHDLGRLYGVLLEMLPISVFGKHYLNKIGSFMMEWTDLPPTTKVDWKIL
ncbi:hypothetical protein F5X68DRAFT_238658 [Plectosphaerella plurivora]|uniref:Heterokaryon incompatibility domain-containing protein n=1 Tax=Plectosphaerella plurivora TaxID=936078 RepID=A0A9P8VMQ4_9PEZI|nr:hypothetical protein F5X68DRAFT_238658 [Plectosphaerella plurivora]